jgi:Fe-S-cluster-containing dehydrogenase component
MTRLGFVIDQRSCIGCNACTVACKAEHGVELGVFRTWVKYIEKGAFPDTRPVLLGDALQPLRRCAVRRGVSSHRLVSPR